MLVNPKWSNSEIVKLSNSQIKRLTVIGYCLLFPLKTYCPLFIFPQCMACLGQW